MNKLKIIRSIVKSSWLLLIIFHILQGCLPSDNIKSSTLVLSNATIYDGNGQKIYGATIVIEGSKVKNLGSEEVDIPDGAKYLDLDGKFITPGLIDAHVHYFQTGFYDSRPDALDLRDSLPYEMVQSYQRKHPKRYHEAYLRSGVTGVYDVGGFLWSIELAQSAEYDLNAPHVAASGPLITLAPPSFISTFNTPGSNVIIYMDSEETVRKSVRENVSLGATGIKLWALADQDLVHRSTLQALEQEIERQGTKLIVHATELVPAKAALQYGAKLLVHSVSDTIVDDEFISLMKRNECIYTPTLIVTGGYEKTMRAVNGDPFEMKDPNGVIDSRTSSLISNATDFQKYVDMEALKERLNRFRNFKEREDPNMFKNLKKLYDAGVMIAVGTDAGNPGTLHGISIYDEMEAMQKAGLSAEDLIIMATRNGAMAMDRLDDFGTLEPGKMADLIILNEDPGIDIFNMRTITHVMRGGFLRPVNEKF